MSRDNVTRSEVFGPRSILFAVVRCSDLFGSVRKVCPGTDGYATEGGKKTGEICTLSISFTYFIF